MAFLENLSKIPSPKTLRNNAISMALITEMIDLDEFFQFHKKNEGGFEIAKLDNNEDDWVEIYFSDKETFVLGLDHYALVMSKEGEDPYGIASEFPKGECPSFIKSKIEDDSFSFLVWDVGNGWQASSVDMPEVDEEGEELDDPDGAEMFLGPFCWNPTQYQQFLLTYYDRQVPLEAIESVFAGEPISKELVKAFNADVLVDEIYAWIRDNDLSSHYGMKS